MGKRRDIESLEQDVVPVKRIKKHKRMRIQQKPVEEEDDNDDSFTGTVPSESECVDIESSEATPNTSVECPRSTGTIKATSTPICASKSVVVASTSAAASASASAAATPAAGNSKKRKRNGKDSGTSSDEERWLDAIESGKLEEVDDELKKIKDPKLMTARQRAMYERSTDKEPSPGGEMLMSLPTGYKEKVMTAEAIQKAALKSQKRKQLADEKREKDKKKTMERLLKKQETKQRSTGKSKIIRTAEPMISYRNNYDGAFLSIPIDHEFPLKSHKQIDPPKPALCGIPGCNQLKVYNCSKTNLPLCSFACYRKNVAAVRQIMC